MSNLSSPDSAHFIISPDMKAKYDKQFRLICPTSDYMSGEQAKAIMLKSGLPPMILANVWSLADVDADGRMDINEFSIAMHLIALKMKGVEVPRTLPNSLKILVEPPPAFAAFSNNNTTNNQTQASNIAGNAATSQTAMRSAKPTATPPSSSQSSLVHSNTISPSASIPGKMASAGAGPGNLISQATKSIAASAAAAAASANSGSGEWSIPQQSKLKYTQMFNQHDRSRTGFLTGAQARNILLESKLPQAKLAQVWNLADIDADGRLTCDEFVLAMHLIDIARTNAILPAKLPADLIPPIYRHRTSVSSASGAAAGSALSHSSSIDDGGAISPTTGAANADGIMGDLGKSSFEDKRRENFEKGQAELERRRAALAEQQKRERDERERKEREESARKERERLDAERRKREEQERAAARAREIELEKEEAKRRANEVRELARKEMERQRQRELQLARRNELAMQRARIAEEVQRLRSRRKALRIEHEQIDKRIAESKTAAAGSREKVVAVKAEIDAMRTRRDATIARQAEIRASAKAFTDRQLLIEQEKVKLSAQLKTLFANASNGVSTSDQQNMTSFAAMLQAKQLAINQLRAHLERYDQEFRSKRDDVTVGRRELLELKRRFETKRMEAKQFNDQIEAKRVEAEAVRDSGSAAAAAAAASAAANSAANSAANATTSAPPFATAEVEVMSVPQQYEWPTSGRSAAATNSADSTSATTKTQTKFKYRCIYEFEARNADEITIRPGDIVMVDTSACSEPEWLSGEINGKIGWFPQGYAELIDENGTAANAYADTEIRTGAVFDSLVSAGKLPTESEIPAAATTTTPAATATPAATTEKSSGKIGETGNSSAGALKYVTPLYELPATESGHLTLTMGDLIRVTEQHDTWYFGEVVSTGAAQESASGWFPDNYVQTLSDSEVAAWSSSSNSATCAASGDQYYVGLYAYESAEQGDLEFAIDELIFVEKKDGVWWTGVIVDRASGAQDRSRRGVFPSNFVGPASVTDIPTIKNNANASATNTSAAAAAAAAPATAKAVETTASKSHQPLDRKASESTDSPKPKKAKSKAKAEIVIATHAYTGSGPEQLTIEIGQLIQVRKKMDSGWWEGELQAKGKKKQIGWFPASYVKPLGGGGGGPGAAVGSAGSSARSTPDPAAKSTAAAEEPEIERVIAFYAFKAEREDEISIEPNDTVRVLSKPDTTWWRGHNTRTGAIGLFPSNHVQSANKSTGPAAADVGATEPNPNYSTQPDDTSNATESNDYSDQRYDYVDDDDNVLEDSFDDSDDDQEDDQDDYDQQRPQQLSTQQLPSIDITSIDSSDHHHNHNNPAHHSPHHRLHYQNHQHHSSTPTISVPANHTNGNHNHNHSADNLPAYYYSDDSFDSDSDDDDHDQNVNEPGDRDQSSRAPCDIRQESPQLYTVRIMDLKRSSDSARSKSESKRIAGTTKKASSLSTTSTTKSSDNNDNNNNDLANRRRLNIIYELLTTEEMYIKDLYFTLENFRKPLHDSGVLPPEEADSFFTNLDKIYAENYNFYTDLAERLATTNAAGRFCDILHRSLRTMLPTYKSFCSAQMASSRQLQLKLESDSQFRETLTQIARQSKSHLPLSSYLLKPMQRITKYPLLIEKLFDCTPATHPDAQDCARVLRFAKSFCKEINEACRDTENFDKLIWLQKHVRIPAKMLDHVIDFNSETQFIGPRMLQHSGILIKATSSKTLAAFLFNDFLLLAVPNKKVLQKSLAAGSNFFYNQKALELTYTLYRKPLMLDQFVITDLPEFESSLDPGLFRLFVKPTRRHISFRATSVNDCVMWLKQIERAKRHFAEIQKAVTDNQSIMMLANSNDDDRQLKHQSISSSAPIGALFLTVVEALQLYTRNYALNAYCKIRVGSASSTDGGNWWSERTKTIRLEIGSGTGTVSRPTFSRKSGATKDGVYKIVWNENFKINVRDLDESLHVACFDENPYAPHRCIGEASISIRDIVRQRAVPGSITRDVKLRVPNPQLLDNYNIEPSVLITYDLRLFGQTTAAS